jgi:endonuclease/exonuclease/phosphatase (EEP) superfamily protein YafD
MIIYILSAVPVLATALSLIVAPYWWARVFDFPRTQVILFCIIFLAINIYNWHSLQSAESIFIVLLCASIVAQAILILPFTPIYPKQIKKKKVANPDNAFSLLISNVRQQNREFERYIRFVHETNADIVIANEIDTTWAQHIQLLDELYPYQVKYPQDNTYGMILLSKLPLDAAEVHFLIEEDIPSIHASIILPSGKKFRLYCLHPRPPQVGDDVEERDAELLVVGRKIKGLQEPAIVAGDLNDVGWSHTSRLFKRISGLLDPRLGRGFFSTYNAFVPFFRFPLDHIFISRQFYLVDMDRAETFGSDHIPILIKLVYAPDEVNYSYLPKPDQVDKKEAREKIVEGVQESSKNEHKVESWLKQRRFDHPVSSSGR